MLYCRASSYQKLWKQTEGFENEAWNFENDLKIVPVVNEYSPCTVKRPYWKCFPLGGSLLFTGNENPVDIIENGVRRCTDQLENLTVILSKNAEEHVFKGFQSHGYRFAHRMCSLVLWLRRFYCCRLSHIFDNKIAYRRCIIHELSTAKGYSKRSENP